MFPTDKTVSLLSIRNSTAFAEVTRPYACFFNANRTLLAVASSFYAQWSGRNIPLQKEYVHLYEVASLKLINSLDVLNYPINDLTFHPTEEGIVLGAGSYDGGAFYEGELWWWDYTSNRLENLLEDNREVIACTFSEQGSKLRFTLHPTDDLYGETTFLNDTYEVSFPIPHPLKVANLSPLDQTPFTETFDLTATEEKTKAVIRLLETLAAEKGHVFENQYLIWDLEFLNEQTLCVAGNEATIELHQLASNEKMSIRLPTPGDCVELFLNRSKESLYVNVWYRAWPLLEPNTVRVYQIYLPTVQYKEVFVGQHSFSKSSDGYFLARRTSDETRKHSDAIFNEDFERVFQKRLGHYDVFNHYLRIDNTDQLYFLRGKPMSQHQNKWLCSIDPRTFIIEEVFPVEQSPEHYNDLSGIATRDLLLLGGRVYHSRTSSYGTYELRAIDIVTKKEQWSRKYLDCITSFGLLEEGRLVIAAFTSGNIEVIEAATGITQLSFTTQLPDSFPKPLSVATIGNQIAIGLTDGRILLFLLQQAK